MRSPKIIITKGCLGVILASSLAYASFAQSSDQNFPTPITTNQLNGTINPRDIGDARLTSYFYAFNADQGDTFINIVTKNFSGDIDLFMVDGLKPLTKTVIYAGSEESETGRLIYLRKPERLLLRIQGRSPNDEPAVFRLKFGGSFVALAGDDPVEAPKIESAASENSAGIRVNSVGTIISVTPKVKSPKKLESARNSAKKEVTAAETDTDESVAADPTKKKTTTDDHIGSTVTDDGSNADAVDEPAKKDSLKKAKKTKPVGEKPAATEIKADPLASIRLVIQMKDGALIEKPMNEVLKFSVDKGKLTVILRDGHINRYSIFDVAKVTIE